MLDGNTDMRGIPRGPAGCLYARPADRSDRFENVSPRVTLAWTPNSRDQLYLNASTGFRPPEMTELYRLQRRQSVADLDSEHLENWLEVPAAGTDLLQRGRVRHDQERRHPARIQRLQRGNGATRHRGFEYEFKWEPEGLALRAAPERHHRPPRVRFRAIEGGETITRGNDIDTAPRNVHSLDLDLPLGERWQAGFNVTSVGSYFLDAGNSAATVTASPTCEWAGVPSRNCCA